MAWGKFVDGLQKGVKERRDRGKELSVMSLPHLDDAIWGIQKRKLAIIGARPSNGKSALMRQMTLDFIMQNKNVLFFSFEETKENFIENLVSLYGMINNFDLVKGEVDTPKHNDAFNGIKNILIKEHLHIIETRGRTINDFERLVRQCKNVDCVMIDYIQLISSKGFGSEKQAYDEFIKKARELAKEIGCAVIIASQINRTTIQNKQVKPPMLQELKGCIHGDSMVGDKTIKERVDEEDYSPVPTVGGEKKPHKLIDVGEKKCRRIKTKSGKEIIISNDTQMLTEKGWVKAKHLKRGEKVYAKR